MVLVSDHTGRPQSGPARQTGVDWSEHGAGSLAKGDQLRVARVLASGQFRLVILYLIQEQPRHGYDLIKTIEERTERLYSPSPGLVYPALTLLEEAGFVTVAADGNKKLHTISDEGSAHLLEQAAELRVSLNLVDGLAERMKAWTNPVNTSHHRDDANGSASTGAFASVPDRDIPAVLDEVNIARRALKQAIVEVLDEGDEADQMRLAAIMQEAALRIRRGNVDLG